MNEEIARLLLAVSRSPDDSELHQCLGKAYIKQHDYTAAQSAYARAIELNPQNPWNHLYAGNASYSLDDYTQALQHFEAARRLAPRLAIVWVSMADCHAALGQFAAASSCYQTAVEVEPLNETALKNLARFQQWQRTN